MFDKTTFGYVSIALTFLSGAPYIISILRGHTKPHLFTYVLWTIMMAIAAAGQVAAHAGAGAWASIVGAIFCLLILLLSFKHGEKSITRSDWVSLLVGLMAIPLWYITADPLPAVLLVTLIDVAAYIPTFRKSYLKPHEEMVFSHVASNVKHVFSILAMQEMSLTTLVYPSVLFLMNSALIGMLLWRRMK